MAARKMTAPNSKVREFQVERMCEVSRRYKTPFESFDSGCCSCVGSVSSCDCCATGVVGVVVVEAMLAVATVISSTSSEEDIMLLIVTPEMCRRDGRHLGRPAPW